MDPYDGRLSIYFTFDKGRYLAFATRIDSDQAAPHAWWDQLKTFLPWGDVCPGSTRGGVSARPITHCNDAVVSRRETG